MTTTATAATFKFATGIGFTEEEDSTIDSPDDEEGRQSNEHQDEEQPNSSTPSFHESIVSFQNIMLNQVTNDGGRSINNKPSPYLHVT